MIELLLWPFLCCLVLTGIHAYLGLHVVQRGVIFVDLSLAQFAALGTTLAFLWGYDLHGHPAYFFSLGFTVIGAAVFACTRSRSGRIPQEALIGIVYAVASAATVLLLDRSSEGAEHIKYILVGNLLTVQSSDVVKMAVLYSAVGALHWFWRRPFFMISANVDDALRNGYKVRAWDFLFYVSFGVVVTSSVAVAGVLLVFSYLVVPSVIGILFANTTPGRLWVGWGAGFVASVSGMIFSVLLDAPTGASVICTFGLLLAAAGLVRRLVPGVSAPSNREKNPLP
jgi:zinc/manganese transport system permease protein